MQHCPPNSSQKPLFSQFLASSLQAQRGSGFAYQSAYYNQKNNFILANPIGSVLQLYDATTFLPLKGRDLQEANGLVTDASYHEEADTYIFGYRSGFICSYNASNNEVRVLQDFEGPIMAVGFLSSKLYVFSSYHSKGLSLGSLEDDVVLEIGPQNSSCAYAHHLSKRDLLLSGLEDGSMIIYCTRNLPQLKIIGSVIQSAMINGKEYVITATEDEGIKVWCTRKGKLKLIKVIQMGIVRNFVYLENYKMIATVSGVNLIEFLSILTGKLERRMKLGQHEAQRMFLMKDKNMIGLPGYRNNSIEFVQLHPKDEE